MDHRLLTAIAPAIAALPVHAGGITMDGFVDPSYGAAPLVIGTNQTEFGDSILGSIDFASGSELDGCWATTDGTNLYLLFAGNIESNFNKLEVFFDVVPGGQNKLRGDNPDIDVVPGVDSGLNRMGDDGSGNGLTFDPGFEADYWVTATCGDFAPFRFEVRYAEILTNGGGTGGLAGVANGGGAANVIVGANGIMAALDNTNVAGVPFGCLGDQDPGFVPTGVELAIPLSLIGGDAEDIRICAFINGVLHDFMSNQVLGINGTCNLGDPRNIDFGFIDGAQFFTFSSAAPPCPGDADGNNQVDFDDLLTVLAEWGACPGCAADFDGNDTVDFDDLLTALSNWGPC